MIVCEGSHRVVTTGVLFMVGGFALSSLGNETPKTAGLSAKAQLRPEIQPHLLLTIYVQ